MPNTIESALGSSSRAGALSRRSGSVVFGVVIFIASEVMFFGGLISGFFVLRAGSAFWPPPGQPRLPVLVTAFNTVMLLASALTMYRALQQAQRDRWQASGRWMVVTMLLGAGFLASQGREWVRLVGFGLTARSSVYGALFYTIVGAHGLHVAGALVALLFVFGRLRRGAYSAANHEGLTACWIYWAFVVWLWPIIYVTVYLS